MGLKTKNCIRCNSKAKHYTGYVKRGSETITAGFCELHKEYALTHPTSYFGVYEIHFETLDFWTDEQR